MFWKKREDEYLLFISVNEDIYHYETICSIKSFTELNSKFKGKIVIYTDKKSFFLNHLSLSQNVIILDVDKEKIKQLLNGSEYIYRIKILLLLEFVRLNKGKVIFVDGDTFFLRKSNQLFRKINKKKALLHCFEYKIESQINKNYYSFLNKNPFRVTFKSNDFVFTEKATMYNSGVIGLHSDNLKYLELALEILNLLESNKIEEKTLEQLAISLAFSELEIITAENYIFHYWFIKVYRMVLWNYYTNSNSTIILNQNDSNFVENDYVKSIWGPNQVSKKDFIKQIFSIVNNCYSESTKYNIKKNFDKKSLIYKNIN
jgi:hypothetical protein